MRLYHFIKIGLIASLLLLLGTACSSPSQTPPAEDITVQIEVDQELITLQVAAGSTVGEILNEGAISLSGSDRTEPAQVISIREDGLIRVIRVEERLETEQVTIPFEVIRQPTENLPTGQEKLLQAGKNGLKEIVSVRVFENGEEISFNEVSSQELEETRALMGRNFYSYGIDPNRTTLEALFRYSHQQRLCARKLTIEELFEPTSLTLTESPTRR